MPLLEQIQSLFIWMVRRDHIACTLVTTRLLLSKCLDPLTNKGGASTSPHQIGSATRERIASASCPLQVAAFTKAELSARKRGHGALILRLVPVLIRHSTFVHISKRRATHPVSTRVIRQASRRATHPVSPQVVSKQGAEQLSQ